MGAPTGSRTAALAFADRMLSRLSLPSGARATAVSGLPAALRHPDIGVITADRVDATRLYTLSAATSATSRYLTSHPPADMVASGRGVSGVPVNASNGSHTATRAGSATVSTFDWSPRSLPSGIEAGTLTVTVVPAAHGGALLRADAVVTWFPPRTPAEHLNLASIRSLELSAMQLNPHPHTVRQTISSHAVISRLVTLVNGLPAAPPMVLGCPAMFATYRITLLVPAVGGRPVDAVTVTPGGCGTDGVWAAGKAQPALWDPQRKLVALVDHTLGIKPQPGMMRPLPASPPGK
jgi:hypothetical protein